MSTDPTPDPSPLEEALMAIDAAIGTLVMARRIVERGVIEEEAEAAAQLPPAPKPIVTMGSPNDGDCKHEGDLLAITTIGSGAPSSLCADCGEMVTADGPAGS